MTFLNFIIHQENLLNLTVDEFSFYMDLFSFFSVVTMILVPLAVIFLKKVNLKTLKETTSFLLSEYTTKDHHDLEIKKISLKIKDDFSEEKFKKTSLQDSIIMITFLFIGLYILPTPTLTKNQDLVISFLSNNSLKVTKYGVIDGRKTAINVYAISCEKLSVKDCLIKNNL